MTVRDVVYHTDRLKYPMKRVGESLAWLNAGITPMLHFDSNWTPYLEYFLQLPPRKVILELDSTTDIFKAKQILKGHMCIMGDVPASLLKLGTTEEVTTYVKKLIDVVGEDGEAPESQTPFPQPIGIRLL